MFFTRVLRAPKSKYVLVKMESMATGHQFCTIRERKEEKKEMIWFDPLIRQSVIYVEIQKMKGIANVKGYEPPRNIELEKVHAKKPWEF